MDVDAAFDLLSQTESLGRTSPQGLLLLEQAAKYFHRGPLLEGESWPWIQREHTTHARSRCWLWLAEAYEQHGRPGQAHDLFNELLKEDPGDGDVLFRLLRLLLQDGLVHRALQVYRQAKAHVPREPQSRILAVGKQFGIENGSIGEGALACKQNDRPGRLRSTQARM